MPKEITIEVDVDKIEINNGQLESGQFRIKFQIPWWNLAPLGNQVAAAFEAVRNAEEKELERTFKK